MPEATSHLGLYRTGLTSPQHRRHITVARSAIVQDTLEILRGNASRRSKHHFLFIGPRGIGKTHLLSLIEDEIADDSDLAAQYVVARFPEESHRTLSFADFLLGLCKILRDELEDEPAWGEIYDRLHTEEDDSVIVDSLVPALRNENRAHKRTVLVMLENLNEVFTNQIKKQKDIASLRKFFMDDNRCLLIATAPLHFDAVTDVGQPFYDFFDTQILENLSEQGTLDLIRLNLEWEKQQDLLDEFDSLRPRLLALYRMTGGNPRLIVMLYELLAHDSVTAVQQQLQLLLDRITPFYQGRMRDLPAQERAVLETMACMRDQEKTPAAIARQMRQSPQQTSSLLKRLSKSHYLRSTPHPKDKRSRLYTIREGFFDIWLAMNLSRGARRRLPFLLEFFNLFYPSFEAREQKRAELRQRLTDSPDADAEQALDYFSEVGTPEEKGATKLSLAGHYAGQGDAEQARQYLREAAPLALDSVGTWIVRQADGEASTNYLTELQEMIECWDLHRSGDLEALAERLVKLGESLTYRTYSEAKLGFLRDHLEHVTDVKQRIELTLRIAKLLYDLARWNEAETQLDAAMQEAKRLDDPRTTAIVLNELAQLLQATNRLDEAEPLMRRALAIDEESYGADHPDVARDLNNLAQLLKATNRVAEAEPL
ncbi:MAG: tetratricopeptide repeat protein, partial [Actinomycetota bacterium]|nr:tetratricopeptide repeat protein [Actinomycetota bacterium]